MKKKILLPGGKDSGFEVYQRPPEGFNIASASPEEIAHLGYPPRPDDKVALKRYLDLFRQLRADDYVHSPTLHPVANRVVHKRNVAIKDVDSTTVNSGSWSGAVLTPPNGKKFQNVAANFAVPTPSIPGNTVIQVFVSMDFGGYNGDTGGAGVGLENFGGAWTGILLVGETYYQFPSFVAQPGEAISIGLWVASPTSVGMNLTTSNGKISGTQNVPGPLGGNAEFIVGSLPPGAPNPPNFGSLTFTSVCVSTFDGSPTFYNPGSPGIGTTLIDMYGYDGKELVNATVDGSHNVVCQYTGPYSVG